jgi:hypothetical protein
MHYNWTICQGSDIPDIVKLTETQVQNGLDEFVKFNTINFDPVTYSRNITLSVVNQFYLPSTELLSLTRDANNKLLAYTWCTSLSTTPWSDDKFITVKMAMVDMTLPVRTRIRLINDMMDLWECFAISTNTPIIYSNTIRSDQSSFLKLHELKGYLVRGSSAYKKVNTTQATPAN